MINDLVVGFEDAVGEPVIPHELPDVFDRIEFWTFGRQRDDADTVDLPPLNGPAMTITALGQDGKTITYCVSIDAGLVEGGTLQALAFTLRLDTADLGYFTGSATNGFMGHGLGEIR